MEGRPKHRWRARTSARQRYREPDRLQTCGRLRLWLLPVEQERIPGADECPEPSCYFGSDVMLALPPDRALEGSAWARFGGTTRSSGIETPPVWTSSMALRTTDPTEALPAGGSHWRGRLGIWRSGWLVRTSGSRSRHYAVPAHRPLMCGTPQVSRLTSARTPRTIHDHGPAFRD